MYEWTFLMLENKLNGKCTFSYDWHDITQQCLLIAIKLYSILEMLNDQIFIWSIVTNYRHHLTWLIFGGTHFFRTERRFPKPTYRLSLGFGSILSPTYLIVLFTMLLSCSGSLAYYFAHLLLSHFIFQVSSPKCRSRSGVGRKLTSCIKKAIRLCFRRESVAWRVASWPICHPLVSSSSSTGSPFHYFLIFHQLITCSHFSVIKNICLLLI